MLNNKKVSKPIKTGQMILIETSPKKYPDANKHMKRGSVSFVIGNFHIKATWRYHYTPIRVTKIKNNIKPDNANFWQGCITIGTLIACGNEK